MAEWPAPAYALGAKVRYVSWGVPRGAEVAWRIVGRQIVELWQSVPLVSYFVQPWTLTGHVMVDRPLHVWEDQVTPWEEEP